MAHVYGFISANAYNDIKLALMVTSNLLHSKFHKSQGVIVSGIYSSCITENPLFREKLAWFCNYFPIFTKYITSKYTSVYEAG